MYHDICLFFIRKIIFLSFSKLENDSYNYAFQQLMDLDKAIGRLVQLFNKDVLTSLKLIRKFCIVSLPHNMIGLSSPWSFLDDK